MPREKIPDTINFVFKGNWIVKMALIGIIKTKKSIVVSKTPISRKYKLKSKHCPFFSGFQNLSRGIQSRLFTTTAAMNHSMLRTITIEHVVRNIRVEKIRQNRRHRDVLMKVSPKGEIKLPMYKA
jgi:hypothetical protein